jgi:membrane protein EpsK
MDNKLLEKSAESCKIALSTESLRGRFGVNIFSNIAFVFAQICTTLWLTPFLIDHLGIAGFGMVPLVTSIIAYMSVFTSALQSAVTRFLAIDLGIGDYFTANRTFNTALFGIVRIILALIPVLIAIVFAIPTLLDVPTGWEKDTSLLFAILAVSFFVSVTGSIFSVSPFIHSQFHLINLVNIIGLIAKIGCIIALFTIFNARLWYAGGATFIGAAVSFCGYVVLWRRVTPELKIQPSAFERSSFKSLTGMGGWIFLNLTGAMLLSRVDLLVVNAFFGAAMTGGYGSVVQFSILINQFVNAAGNVIRPMILIEYAQENSSGLKRLAFHTCKLFGLALALPVGLLCGFSRSILTLWLGESFEYLYVLLIIIVFHLSLNLSVRPLQYILNAFNKVRLPGIVTLASGIANLGLSILFALWGKWGAAGVAAAGSLVWTFRNAIFTPTYTALIMRLPWWIFFPALAASVIATFFVAITSYVLTNIQMPNTWFTLAVSAAIISFLYIVIIWAIGLNPSDRHFLKSLLRFQVKESTSAVSAK